MLMLAMLAIALATIQGGVASTVTLQTITKNTTNQISAEAQRLAETGIEEARARLGLSSASPQHIRDTSSVDPLWSAYILNSSTWVTSQDPQFNAAYHNYIPTTTSQTATAIQVNSLQTAMPYWVKIRYKREYDAEAAGHSPAAPHYYDGDGNTATHTAASPGNIVYYGYDGISTTPRQFTIATSTNARPVVIIRSYGEYKGKTAVVEVETAQHVGPPATLYVKGNMQFRSEFNGLISGNDNCSVNPAKPPVYTKSPGTTTGTPFYFGTPSTPQSGTLDLDIAADIDRYRGGATVLEADPATGEVYGGPSNYVTLYTDTSNPYNAGGLLLRDVTGHGLLLVKGDLTLKGDTTWKGLIYTTGTLSFDVNSPSQTLEVNGGVYAGAGYVVDDNPRVRFSSCDVNAALGAKPWKVLRWRRIS